MNSILSAFKLIFKSVQIQLYATANVYTGSIVVLFGVVLCIDILQWWWDRRRAHIFHWKSRENNAAPNHRDNKNSKQIINTTLKMDVIHGILHVSSVCYNNICIYNFICTTHNKIPLEIIKRREKRKAKKKRMNWATERVENSCKVLYIEHA